MRNMNILVSESLGFSESARRILQAYGDVELADMDRRRLLMAVGACDVLWVRLRNQIDEAILDAASRLQIIVSATTGLNHIDLEAAAARGIKVLCLRGEVDFLRNVRATAELTIGLMLSMLRQIPQAGASVRQGCWDRDTFRGNELYELPIGIVGYGRLGTLVAGYLHAFGSQVYAYDPFVKISDSQVKQTETLPELLSKSRLVSLHASYSPETDSFFDQSCFAHMQPGSWFVNTARGELVDETALLDALASGHLAGAAVDVLRAETSPTLAKHPLVHFAREHENLLLTPHIGGCTKESMGRAELFMAQKLVEALACAG